MKQISCAGWTVSEALAEIRHPRSRPGIHGNPNSTYLAGRVRKATAQDLRDAARRWLSDGLYQLEVTPYPEIQDSERRVRTVRSSPRSARRQT